MNLPKMAAFFKGKQELTALYALLSPDKARLTVFATSLVASSAIGLCFPLAMVIANQQDLYNLATVSSTSEQVFASLAKWSAVVAVGSVANYYRRFTIEDLVICKQGNRLAVRMREDLWRELLQKNMTFHSSQSSGNLSHRLGNDISMIASSLTLETSTLLRGGAFFSGGVGFLLYSSPQLMLVSMVPMGAMAYISKHYGEILKHDRSMQADSLRALAEYVQERLSQIKTVKLYTAEGQELKTLQKANADFYEKSLKVAKVTAKNVALIEMLGQTGILWCVGYGCLMILNGSGMTIGTLTAFAAYSLYAGLGLRMLSFGYSEIKKISGVYDKIRELYSEELREEVLFNNTPPLMLARGPRITFDNVSFSYASRNTKILDKFSLDIEPGEFIGIVGPSGCGKSTLFHLISRLYEPDSGKIFIDGEDISQKPTWWLRQQIAVVSQEALLFSASIADNIKYSKPDASDAEVSEAVIRSGAQFALSLPDALETQTGEHGAHMSGGQRQRIAIARAMLKTPSILLLDEATSGLDVRSEQIILEVLEKHFKHRGPTVLFITHRSHCLKDLADRVVVLKEGRVAEDTQLT